MERNNKRIPTINIRDLPKPLKDLTELCRTQKYLIAIREQPETNQKKRDLINKLLEETNERIKKIDL